MLFRSRRVVTGESEYVFLYGFSEPLAREAYFTISSLQIEDIENLDEIESSALAEITSIMTTYITGILSDEPAADLRYQDAVVTSHYTDGGYNLSDGIVISIETDHGNMEVLYCKVK